MSALPDPHDLTPEGYAQRAARLVVLTLEAQGALRSTFDPEAALHWLEQSAPSAPPSAHEDAPEGTGGQQR
jgi:hypothetical protein